MQRFWKYVKLPAQLHDCWEWEGGLDSKGYGILWVQGKNALAHRLSYEHFKGRIPKGKGRVPRTLLICHSCDNPKCVNPFHLWVGTYRDNTRDMIQKGRGKLRENGLNSRKNYSHTTMKD